MQLTYDAQKDAENVRRHGLSLKLAADLDRDSALVWIDTRFDYEELRMIALAPGSSILYYVAFVDRLDERRIIILRRAKRREVTHYVEST